MLMISMFFCIAPFPRLFMELAAGPSGSLITTDHASRSSTSRPAGHGGLPWSTSFMEGRHLHYNKLLLHANCLCHKAISHPPLLGVEQPLPGVAQLNATITDPRVQSLVSRRRSVPRSKDPRPVSLSEVGHPLAATPRDPFAWWLLQDFSYLSCLTETLESYIRRLSLHPIIQTKELFFLFIF